MMIFQLHDVHIIINISLTLKHLHVLIHEKNDGDVEKKSLGKLPQNYTARAPFTCTPHGAPFFFYKIEK